MSLGKGHGRRPGLGGPSGYITLTILTREQHHYGSALVLGAEIEGTSTSSHFRYQRFSQGISDKYSQGLCDVPVKIPATSNEKKEIVRRELRSGRLQ
jgi:hypothetical protein